MPYVCQITISLKRLCLLEFQLKGSVHCIFFIKVIKQNFPNAQHRPQSEEYMREENVVSQSFPEAKINPMLDNSIVSV